jgi:hypothetical protein
MTQQIDLHQLLSQTSDNRQRTASFALLSLGVIESLVGEAMTPSSAVELFFHADNCQFVRRRLRLKAANEIMSRGVQLPDLFEALSTQKAQQEFQRELLVMRLLCLKLLGGKQLAA